MIPILCQGTLLCVGSMPSTNSQAVSNFALALISCLYRASSQPEVKAQGLSRSFLSIFIAMGMCTTMYIGIVFQNPRNTWELSKAFMNISFSSSSWLVHCLPPLLFTSSGSYEVKQLTIILLTNVLREKSVCTGRTQSQVKYRQQVRSDIDSKDRNYQPDEIMIILWE